MRSDRPRRPGRAGAQPVASLQWVWPLAGPAEPAGAAVVVRERVTGVGETARMAFGQASGPPASGKQVQELLSLLQEAGHSDFRDARGPMGFSQRQAAGKFTRAEADAF